MKALSKSKCFRRGHDFTGDWGGAIILIILITAISFPNRQTQTGTLSARSKQNLKFDCEDVGFVQIINWRDIVIFSTTAAIGFVLLTLGIRNLIRFRQHVS